MLFRSVAITGAISALTLILGYVFGMKAWQYPLVLLGLIAVISGPSMIIAWLKLRQRMLGPILEGSGWAVNGRVKINLPLGSALTDLAQLPPRAERLLNDPYEDKEAARRTRERHHRAERDPPREREHDEDQQVGRCGEEGACPRVAKADVGSRRWAHGVAFEHKPRIAPTLPRSDRGRRRAGGRLPL